MEIDFWAPLSIKAIFSVRSRKAGTEFLQNLVANNVRLPMISYVVSFKKERGTPLFAFGITNSPSELVHLVMDVIERK